MSRKQICTPPHSQHLHKCKLHSWCQRPEASERPSSIVFVFPFCPLSCCLLHSSVSTSRCPTPTSFSSFLLTLPAESFPLLSPSSLCFFLHLTQFESLCVCLRSHVYGRAHDSYSHLPHSCLWSLDAGPHETLRE